MAGRTAWVEREIMEFFAQTGSLGLRISPETPGRDETPTEWFIRTITRFTTEEVTAEVQDGTPTREALSRALLAACSYAVPAYYVGRAVQLDPSAETDEALISYLQRHPSQLRQLCAAPHVAAVPDLEPRIRSLLSRALQDS
ncbi:hypothetical protein [Longimicrobium terrae]|uniref:Uncharacterized protein n=1 Tax=Longimicrobium terrae TaxID=1639882 RepID=A0A841GWA6_9BACT|nr:hypothetical protein [Longimicrobium terrae]MBB4635892.1 hypothetical protein [Longimicrobium terrae]MBB6070288.1 hypothetical protein [Longimicrobium terrae]NNC30791.1 hypothetical protein [Longimicrobium terrae]